ncbi:MAG: cytochrome c biogenesis protein ResB [Nitrospirae bacterium]|nr:cytochrome c biogenesis protein ResB [Nitrospirota bacterium]
MNIFGNIYNFLSSYKLAMALLVTILASCVIGTVFFSQDESWALVFSTLWFNGLLVALVVNVAFCFFGRIWRRKITLISFGMILFHLSFVAILGGVVYNSLFYFRGLMRLTEGETLSNGALQSYNYKERGRFFDISNLKGEITLVNVQSDYKVDGVGKGWAYNVSISDGGAAKEGIIYITNSLDYNGVSYYNDKEGYSILTILYDKEGREIYGGHISLQSLKQKDDTYFYTTGTKDGPGTLPFPYYPVEPLFNLQAAYFPDSIKNRAGEVFFQVWPLNISDARHSEKAMAEGQSPVGERLQVGDYYLAVQEVRYWAGINVSYEPGKPIVLGSLWMGLGGMVITFIGRLRRGRS